MVTYPYHWVRTRLVTRPVTFYTTPYILGARRH